MKGPRRLPGLGSRANKTANKILKREYLGTDCCLTKISSLGDRGLILFSQENISGRGNGEEDGGSHVRRTTFLQSRLNFG